jgi:predicted RNase H-like HicB family nuclease
MITQYIQKKMASAHYKILDDGTYFGEIPSIRGVWANSKTLEGCRLELNEVLEEWLLLSVRQGVNIPGLKNIVGTGTSVQYA